MINNCHILDLIHILFIEHVGLTLVKKLPKSSCSMIVDPLKSKAGEQPIYR